MSCRLVIACIEGGREGGGERDHVLERETERWRGQREKERVQGYLAHKK